MNNAAFTTTSKRLVEYITQVYKPCLVLGDWQASKDLPLYLQGGWAYQVLDLEGRKCLLMLDEHVQQDTAQRLSKTIQKVSAYFDGPIIYGVSEITSYNRKRLIDQGVPFVVPGKQLYLPFMALDLRENFSPVKQATVTRLSASAQQLLLIQLFGLWQDDVSAQVMAKHLSVSKMTISRAYKELEELGLARFVMSGRTSHLVFKPSSDDLWQDAKPYLSSPVKKQVWISANQYQQHEGLFKIAAGENALAMLGMLSSPKHPSYAISATDWSSLKKLTGIEQQDQPDDDSVLIELWRYEPDWLKIYGSLVERVDKVSLYLSLIKNDDQRIQMALDDIVDGFLKDGMDEPDTGIRQL
jgi:Mn-dependent DtxR family transcriptional regulator